MKRNEFLLSSRSRRRTTPLDSSLEWEEPIISSEKSRARAPISAYAISRLRPRGWKLLNFIIPFIALNIPLATKELIKGIVRGAVKG